MGRVFIKTLGCKVNLSDTHALVNRMGSHGYELTEDQAGADLTIINTCSVTANAEKEALSLARKYKRDHPATHLVLTGCYAQTDSAKLLDIKDIDFILPNALKHEADEQIIKSLREGQRFPVELKPVELNKQGHFKTSHTLFGEMKSEKSRAFLKIQDGCNGFCSYCLIPYARGASRSVDQGTVLAEIKQLSESGYTEVVLTGIHVGDYGEDLGTSFANLLNAVCENTGIERIRISSLEPSELKPTLLDVLIRHKDRICDHFHLPLQSASNDVLKRMNRTYTFEQYKEHINSLRTIFPNANVGADILVGFPGESDSDFEQSMAAMESCDLNYAHVFPYSKRPNTAASRMPMHISPDLIRERSKELRLRAAKAKESYLKKQIGTSQEILWQDHGSGLTRNYLKVVVKDAESSPKRSLQRVKILGLKSSDELLAKAF
jgi:threonylcarbamoyladenosine tRNA methylthiotransferase MtaB